MNETQLSEAKSWVSSSNRILLLCVVIVNACESIFIRYDILDVFSGSLIH